MTDRRFPYLNQAVVCGVVSRKPSLRTNKSGVATLKVSLTVSLPTLSDDLKSKRLSTVRVPVFIVGSLAVECGALLTTGSEVVVEGWLSSPPARGSASRLEVHAERVQVVDVNGLLQFVEKDLSVGTPAEVAPAAVTEATVTETIAVEEQRPASKNTESTKSAATESAPESSAGESVTKPRRTHGRRKRPVAPTLSASDLPTSELPTSEKVAAKPRRRRTAGNVSRRPLSGGTRKGKSDTESVRKKKESRESKEAKESPVLPETSSATVSTTAKPERRSKRSSTARKPSTRRPRRSAQDTKGSEGKSSDSLKPDTSKSATLKQKAKSGAQSGAKADAKSGAKPGGNSPFELVETDDSFDPFLLEE